MIFSQIHGSGDEENFSNLFRLYGKPEILISFPTKFRKLSCRPCSLFNKRQK